MIIHKCSSFFVLLVASYVLPLLLISLFPPDPSAIISSARKKLPRNNRDLCIHYRPVLRHDSFSLFSIVGVQYFRSSMPRFVSNFGSVFRQCALLRDIPVVGHSPNSYCDSQLVRVILCLSTSFSISFFNYQTERFSRIS